MRILLIEDQPQAEKFIWSVLSQRWWGGITLESSPSFSHALDTLKMESFDLIVVDMGVPDLQGPEGLGRVSEITGKQTVLLLVDEKESDAMMTCRQSGIRNWVTKESLTPSKLADAVKGVLQFGQAGGMAS